MRNLLLLAFIVLPCGLVAQQNFFNVPSSEITECNKVFLQQQFNLYSGSCVSNTTFCYGLGHESELGVNLFGVTYDYVDHRFIASPADEQPVFPSLGFNAQRQFTVAGWYEVSLGGQLLLPRQLQRYECYAYLNNRLHADRLKVILGLFAGNDNYFDSESRFNAHNRSVGVQGGFEYEVLRDRFYLQSDYITGQTALSNLIVGGAYKVTPTTIVSAGYQIPNNTRTSAPGVVVELTYVQ
ncbi:MAG: hypothetical protein FGM24_04755 [Candidatus Kapabacteria bacterium]|nr:hypothetical protein [Candidatus Kapabacteria bacterium]